MSKPDTFSGRIVAVVPARAGSERVPNKNTRPFADTTLFTIKIQQMVALWHEHVIDGVVANTNCPRATEIAEALGVGVHQRDAYHASGDCSNTEYWRYLAQHTDCEHLLMAQPTSPLVSLETYQRAILAYRSMGGVCDSAISVEPVKEFLWQDGNPLNYDPATTPRSQQLPDIMKLTFGVCLANRAMMLERGNVVGRKPWFVPLDWPEGLDIDDEADFRFAEMIYREKLGERMAA